jgi:hypothetical protein
MRQVHRNVIRALNDNASVIARFWTQVETNDSTSDCWVWRGSVRHQGYPTVFIGSHSIAATHVAWFTATGELPSGGRIHQMCENQRCVRPEHLAWAVSRRTVIDARARYDGYVAAPGIPIVECQRAPRHPRVMRYVSAQRTPREVAPVNG